jgi:hypothetical protein
MQSDKFKEALNVIIEEIKKEVNNDDIHSIEFVLNTEKKEMVAPKAIMGGVCTWDPVRKQVVCHH